MIKQFRVGRSTIIFKKNIVKLINKHPKIKNFSEIGEGNSSQFELVKKNLFKIYYLIFHVFFV